MTGWSEIFDLIETRVIDSYKGPVEVLGDQKSDLLVVRQGERILVMNLEQAADLVQTLMYKVREK